LSGAIERKLKRLRALKATHGSEVTIFNSHDPVDYENWRCGASRAD
jgi:hypothetical protein